MAGAWTPLGADQLEASDMKSKATRKSVKSRKYQTARKPLAKNPRPKPSALPRPLLQSRLVDFHAESWTVERQDRAVGVLHRVAHHVAREQQRAEQLAAPRDRGRRERHLQIGSGAEGRLDHASDVAAHTRRFGDSRDGDRAQDAGRLRELEGEDAHP